MLSYEQRLEQAADYLIVVLTLRCPNIFFRGSNVLRSTIRKAWENGKTLIVIGGEIAPYAVYTNEPWLSPKWNGKENPNLYWIQSAIEEARPVLVAMLSGTISQEEYNQMVGAVQADITAAYEQRAAELEAQML